VTSDEKSTWPGESIMFNKYWSLLPVLLISYSKYNDTPVDLMVIPLSYSSFLVSIVLLSPAYVWEIIPAQANNESVKVDFP